jgi:hypothetical protein
LGPGVWYLDVHSLCFVNNNLFSVKNQCMHSRKFYVKWIINQTWKRVLNLWFFYSLAQIIPPAKMFMGVLHFNHAVCEELCTNAFYILTVQMHVSRLWWSVVINIKIIGLKTMGSWLLENIIRWIYKQAHKRIGKLNAQLNHSVLVSNSDGIYK